MKKLMSAKKLRDITDQSISEKARELLEVIIDTAMERATQGRYHVDIHDENMVEIENILERKGYRVTNLSDIHWYRISWY